MLKQAEALATIFRNKGEVYDFNEIWDWGGRDKFSERASKVIADNYFDYYKIRDEVIENEKEKTTISSRKSDKTDSS